MSRVVTPFINPQTVHDRAKGRQPTVVIPQRRRRVGRTPRVSAGVPELLIVTTIAWGVLAFGAVYPWAYVPLLAAAATVGLWGLWAGASASDRTTTHLSVAIAAIGAAFALQLVPLPARVLAALSPATDRLLRTYDLGYATAGAHPLSIVPKSTLLGLVCFVAFAIFTLGCARRLTTTRAIAVVRAIALLGVAVAIVGVVQKASGTYLIYGFWRPVHNPYQIFGPFVNKNHYAGWMIMALSLTVGSFGSGIADGLARIKAGWRDRLLWLSSPGANYLILAAFGTPMMIAALLMTLSRSGIACWTVAMALGALLMRRRSAGRNRAATAVAIVYGAVTVFLVASWSRPDAIVERFSGGSAASFEGRLGAWTDAMRIARDFPATGTGLNTFDTAMIFYQSQSGAHWDAAHNDYVQLIAEGGILITIPALIGVLVFVREVSRRLDRDRADPVALWLRLGAVVGLVAIGLQEFVDFSLQLPGNAVLFALLAAIALHGSSPHVTPASLASAR